MHFVYLSDPRYSYRRYVALKIFVQSKSLGQYLDNELKIYKRLEGASRRHPGRKYVRSLLDSFDLTGPEDRHRCLVHPPLWESVLAFLNRNPIRRLPVPILAVTLHRLFLALDYLHTECKIIHTGTYSYHLHHTLTFHLLNDPLDIKADNLMFGIDDDSVFRDFEEKELQDPCPRKELDGRTIYTSRDLAIPRNIGAPILCDFSSAVLGDRDHSEDIQPNIYRAPEVILEIPWTYSVDVWNAGCVVRKARILRNSPGLHRQIWNLFEGGSLFSGRDSEFQTYRSRTHLAEMIRLLGPPPRGLLTRGNQTSKFFSDKGNRFPYDYVSMSDGSY